VSRYGTYALSVLRQLAGPITCTLPTILEYRNRSLNVGCWAHSTSTNSNLSHRTERPQGTWHYLLHIGVSRMQSTSHCHVMPKRRCTYRQNCHMNPPGWHTRCTSLGTERRGKTSHNGKQSGRYAYRRNVLITIWKLQRL